MKEMVTNSCGNMLVITLVSKKKHFCLVTYESLISSSSLSISMQVASNAHGLCYNKLFFKSPTGWLAIKASM